jgi:hydrogenase maturation protease
MCDKILVLGIGNYLMGDEGVGVHMAQHLKQIALPIEVEVVDGSIGGFHLFNYFSQYKTIIIVYAASDNQAVGGMRTIRPKCASDFFSASNTHYLGMKEIVHALQLADKIGDVWLIVVSIEAGQQSGVELSHAMETHMPALIKKVDTLAHSFLHTEVAF